jgi:hypothetical protein
MRSIAIVWQVFLGVVYVAVVFGIMSAAENKFQTLVLASLIELYAAVLYNFSMIGEVTDVNTHAAFARFRMLAAAHGIIGSEDQEFKEQEEALVDAVNAYRPKVWIWRISNGIVSAYALIKIVQAVL